MVGAARFELATSCTPSKRANQATLRPGPPPTRRRAANILEHKLLNSTTFNPACSLDNAPPLAKRDGVNPKFGLRSLLVAFAVIAAGYFASFYGIEHLRSRNGPWQVVFTSDAGTPAIVINQPKLQIQNVKIIFPGAPATNAGETIRFNHPRQVPFPVPFGQCVFLDIISLPGTVTLQLFGHEIQLLPRVLTIDRQEQPWSSNTTVKLE
jgi:hypothetical protein